MIPYTKSAHLLLMGFFLIVGVACQPIEGDALVIIEEGGKSSVVGELKFSLNSKTGKFGHDLLKPGLLYLFRADQKFGNVLGKTGEIYKASDEGTVEKVGDFDITKTDEELVKEFLAKSK